MINSIMKKKDYEKPMMQVVQLPYLTMLLPMSEENRANRNNYGDAKTYTWEE